MASDLADLLDDAFSVEEADDEVVVVAGRPHRDDEPLRLGAAFREPDLERLLGDEGVLLPARAASRRRGSTSVGHRGVAVRSGHAR